jgi:hypothetical protein
MLRTLSLERLSLPAEARLEMTGRPVGSNLQ